MRPDNDRCRIEMLSFKFGYVFNILHGKLAAKALLARYGSCHHNATLGLASSRFRELSIVRRP
jgi:hypothetical protein